MARLSGKNGSVALAGTNYAFGKWEVTFDGEDPEVTNFDSSGFFENLAGIDKSEISLDGPYNTGAMAMTRGNVYVFTLRMSSSVYTTVAARIKSIKVVTDVKDAVRISVQATSNGVYTPGVG
ncbi:MAG TPA: hypothetical protein VF526_15405 [Solirubrobacteraceae bacterium]|jgi:hypothetical protein